MHLGHRTGHRIPGSRRSRHDGGASGSGGGGGGGGGADAGAGGWQQFAKKKR